MAATVCRMNRCNMLRRAAVDIDVKKKQTCEKRSGSANPDTKIKMEQYPGDRSIS